MWIQIFTIFFHGPKVTFKYQIKKVKVRVSSRVKVRVRVSGRVKVRIRVRVKVSCRVKG